MSYVEKVKQETAQRLRDAEMQDRIAAKVPEGFRQMHPHLARPLYDRVATLKYGDPFSSRVMDGQVVPWDRVVELVESMPPVSLTEVRDGCLSFRPTSHVAAIPEDKKQRWESETEVAGVLLHVEKGDATLEWTTEIGGVGLVEVEVFVGELPAGIGSYEPGHYVRDGSNSKWVPTRLGINGEATVAYHYRNGEKTGEPVAEVQSPIRWAGERGYERFTLFFVSLGETVPDVLGQDIVRGLAERAKIRAK